MAGKGTAINFFTFIWKVQNADYWWKRESIESPIFTAEEVDETKWKLHLRFSYFDRYSGTELELRRQVDSQNEKNVEIDCELAFLASDGTVLHSFEAYSAVIARNGRITSDDFPSRHEVFFARRSLFFSQDSLTIRCKIGKSHGEATLFRSLHCFLHTRIAVEKRSLVWDIEDFSSLETDDREAYEIKSLGSGERLLSLELVLTGRLLSKETIRLKIIPNYETLKIATIKLSIVDASKNAVKCFADEFWVDDPSDSKDFTLCYSKRELMEKKSAFLPNDVLSLLCECSFCFGTLEEEIDGGTSGNSEPIMITKFFPISNCPIPKGILIDDFRSMLNNSFLSDVKLKTKSKTFPAHKLILGVRSPVFKAMFSNDMKEKINDCVDIEDLSDQTVLRILRYIYCAEVEELEWGSATQLYEAADKYQILDLKGTCSSYLRRNVNSINACEALVLFDMHQDQDLKVFIQDFILRHGKEIINSEDWKQLMETNLKLAAETMCRQFKE